MEEPSKAYVLVQTDARTDRIARMVRGVPGVLFAEDVRGPYDVLALARSDGEILGTILDQVRGLPGVIRALAAPIATAPIEVPSSDAA